MKISPISSQYSLNKSFPNNKSTKNQSFKSIFIENKVDLGKVSEKKGLAKFLPKDYLLLNDIASLYPNQDCFIRQGYSGYPRLEYREKPPQVQMFVRTMSREYQVNMNPYEKDYPVVPLLLYENDNLNKYIGVPSYISTNPSLPYTVQAGYELHKKLIEKKYEILKGIGKTGDGRYDIGEDTLLERAHKEIEDVEIAVTRYLLECAMAALTDRASGRQIYESVYPKIQSRYEAKRKYDLTTSIADRKDYNKKEPEHPNICKIATEKYPDKKENEERIKQIKNHLGKLGVTLV